MVIRKIKKSEIESLAKLMIDKFSRPPFNEDVKIVDVVKSLNFYNDNAKIYVLGGNDILGAIVFQVEQWWEGSVAVIQDLFTVDDNDEILIEFLEKYCRKNNIIKIYFETHKKSASINKYKKLGYKINKSRISMEKKINDKS